MKRFFLATAAVALAASTVVGQARVLGLGGNDYINDPSRVFANPAKIGEYPDMLYGESGSRVFGTLNLFDGVTIGVSAPQALAHEFAYGVSTLGAPGDDNLHFALAVGPFGVEVSSEGKSETDITSPVGGTELDQSTSIRSFDLKGGINLPFLDAAVGLGYITESDLSGSAPGVVDETSGSGIGLNADGSIMFGGETRFGAFARYGMETFQETEIVTGLPDAEGPSHSLMVVRAGALGEIQIADPAKFYLLGGVGMDVAAEDEDTTKTTISRFILPEIRAGFEYDFGKVWRIQDVLVRAGASKVTATPIKTTVENGAGETSTKAEGDPGATIWTLGAGMRQGNFSLDATVAPGTLDGVYFLNGAGPVLASITLSYKFRGGSSSSSSSSSYDAGSSMSTEPSSGMSTEPATLQ